jgi:serine/threonine protein kinase
MVHIFVAMLEVVLLLKEQDYCHSDLKPDNVTLVPVEGKKDYYEARIIDFGELSRNSLT